MASSFHRPTFIWRLVLGGLALLGIVLTVINPVLEREAPDFAEAISPERSTEEEWVIRQLDLAYRLERNDDGHSRIVVTEVLNAVFSAERGSTGFVRHLVHDFDQHEVDPEIISVRDADGNELDYRRGRDEQYRTLHIDAGRVLDGDEFFTIEYAQEQVTHHDVVREAPSDSTSPVLDGEDLFRWNVMGYWKQPAARATLTVTLDEALRERLIGTPEATLFWAIIGDRAPMREVDDGVYAVEIDSTIPPTSIIGAEFVFEPGTFTPSERSLRVWAALLLPYLPIFAAVPLFIAAIVNRLGNWRDAPGRGLIITQYEPPEGINLLQAGTLLGGAHRRRALPAQLLSLAVRGVIRVDELPTERRGLGSRRGYRIQLLNAHGLDEEESRLLVSLFPLLRTGDVARIDSPGQRLRLAVRDVSLDTLRRQIGLGLRRVPTDLSRVILVLGPVAAATLQMGFWRQSAYALEGVHALLVPLVSLVAIVLAALAWTIAITAFPLTPAGAEAKEHLLGLREYIRLAKAERLRFFQSAQTVGRGAVPTAEGEAHELELEEQMLPYAALFGLERSWLDEITVDYRRRRGLPGWLTERALQTYESSARSQLQI